jgi:hypothetical protein
MIPYKFIGEFIETRIIDIHVRPYISSNITFSNNTDFVHNYGYKNMRFEDNFKDIFEIKLVLGEKTFDVLYPKNNPDHKTLNILDQNIIPCIKDVNYTLVICSGIQTSIKCIYDIYKITNPTSDSSIKYIRNIHNGGEICRSEANHCKNYSSYILIYKHIITELTIFSNNKLSDIYLYTNDKKYIKPFISEPIVDTMLEDEYSIKYKYVCRLEPHINFSKVSNPHIKYGFTENTIIYVFCKSLKIANITSRIII